MLSNAEVRTIQLRAIVHAKRARRRLECEDHEWVDVFEAIERLGVLLFFTPIRSLCGAYMPRTHEDGAAGILVSTVYPLGVQRLTAAHELGHLLMNHAPSLDHETEVDGLEGGAAFAPRALAGRVRDPRVDPAQEIAAESFAAHFLMPRSQVVRRIKTLGWTENELRTPEAVYELSLWFGVSYAAMVWHLVAVRLLSYDTAAQIAKTKPKSIKQSLGGQGALPNWQNDVWPLQATDSGSVIHARVGDALAITLPSHADGGYLWEPAAPIEGFEVINIAPTFEDSVIQRARERTAFLAGYSPRQRALVRLTTDGTLAIGLAECLPWERSRTAGVFHVTVIAQQAIERGLSPRLRRRHLALVG